MNLSIISLALFTYPHPFAAIFENFQPLQFQTKDFLGNSYWGKMASIDSQVTSPTMFFSMVVHTKYIYHPLTHEHSWFIGCLTQQQKNSPYSFVF
jgi:hypothetical protein